MDIRYPVSYITKNIVKMKIKYKLRIKFTPTFNHHKTKANHTNNIKDKDER